MTKEELIDSIRNNRSFDLRSSEYYEPWDVLQETIKEMADDFYYLLKNVLDYLEDPKPKFDIGDTIRPKGSKAEYTITSISGGCYHGKGWGLPIDAEKDYELVEPKSAEVLSYPQYTRTDAFTEKAANFLRYRLFNRVEVVEPGKATESIIGKNEFIEEFKKEMRQ